MSEWVAKGERGAILRLALWIAIAGALAVGGVFAYQFLSIGHEYMRTTSPSGNWRAMATEAAGSFRVSVRRRGLEYSPTDVVWRARGVRPMRLKWQGDDSLVVFVHGGEPALSRVVLGKPEHEFVDPSKTLGATESEKSVHRIGVSTVPEDDGSSRL